MRRPVLEVSTLLEQVKITPTENGRVEKLMRIMQLPSRAEVVRQALACLWERSESERLARKAEKADK